MLYGINASHQNHKLAAALISSKPGLLPFTYLGLAVGSNMNHIVNWVPIIDPIDKRLSKWKENNVSIGGHLTLLKSVLEALPWSHMMTTPSTSCEERVDQVSRFRSIILLNASIARLSTFLFLSHPFLLLLLHLLFATLVHQKYKLSVSSILTRTHFQFLIFAQIVSTSLYPSSTQTPLIHSFDHRSIS
ncbi:hypothetical protein QVD17_00343 [Tagetes erecta]|uniref:Uncharacterized protein n=1 Tax=Tagetes erecta TaxID=13708 RepID=A0AAD8P0I1_TARER|nr:hypothetical protein QVD17_00343 [Tagetes erecta]